MSRTKLVVFAQVPPPEHGQSRMVAAMLDALNNKPEAFEVEHVNASFSQSLKEIGEGSLIKFLKSIGYIVRLLIIRLRCNDPILYYIPGPVKWSAILRDWLLLGTLRIFYKRTIFHWHAIGHGEWAHGSKRVNLRGPELLVRMAQRISAAVLESPELSVVVSPTSRRDADAVGSTGIEVVYNGIEDPCPDALASVPEPRKIKLRANTGCLRYLFLSHGTESKGLNDMLAAFVAWRKAGSWRPESCILTIAGGVADSARNKYEDIKKEVLELWGSELKINELGFVSGVEKWECYRTHDIFIAPSRWESFGLTVAEAMAHGMPVVAASSDGVSGVLPADYPYLSPVSDPNGLSLKLEECGKLVASGDASELAKALRDRFLSEFQFKQFSSHIVEAFIALNHHDSPDRAEGKSLRILAYLADQNPGLGRSLGISRMTEVVLSKLSMRDDVILSGIVSRSSVRLPKEVGNELRLPWSTRSKAMRVLTDHFHPLATITRKRAEVCYFPKGFMPKFSLSGSPAVATIHDTIIQYYQDKYPKWRLELEYNYWAGMLRNTLRQASAVLTVSEHAKGQILDFIKRHKLEEKEIFVTYEPCLYEDILQPVNPAKAGYVLHLGSNEPHKRTAWLIRLWARWTVERRILQGMELPKLHIVGSIPGEVRDLANQTPSIVYLPFLEDQALQSQFTAASALILPSEIEGFGLPALEAYYMGTPVCFQLGTSVEEILGSAAQKGGFEFNDEEGLFGALDQILTLSPSEIRSYGLMLRDTYHSSRIVDRMMGVFRHVANQS